LFVYNSFAGNLFVSGVVSGNGSSLLLSGNPSIMALVNLYTQLNSSVAALNSRVLGVSVTYSQAFLAGQTPSEASWIAWSTFRRSLIGNFQRWYISSSLGKQIFQKFIVISIPLVD
jgi:hypothetical protein